MSEVLRRGISSDGVSYTVVRRCRAKLGMFICGRPLTHKGPHETGTVDGDTLMRWRDTTPAGSEENNDGK